MAVLEDRTREAAFSLSTRTTVGRSARSSIVLGDEAVSGVHASIEWTSDGWSLRDLGSRNGTYLNGSRIRPLSPVPVEAGAEMAFGNPELIWRLVDVGPPQLVARSDSGRFVFAEGDVLALPSREGAELTLIRDGHRWEYELDSSTRFAVDQSVVELRSGCWRLLVPEVLSETTLIGADASMQDLSLHFVASRNEEHIEILVNGPNVHEHFDHRAHSYLLLTLARIRLEDAESSELPAAEHGWIERERLEDLLKLETQHLNLLVHRARKHFSRLGIANASAIVERRSGSTQLRIGTGDLAVIGPA